ncbi:hypothetical protein EVAR_25516_1 [Eumeta japonica]|uniref:Uncharacterized protein n=1 Tax=Eumeta variegata TaxID=151549 RepID=A0A4C1VMQ4_EUMVA|nr:hypothetical protein EVAR_25516_1 [Eumeta japonica]
MFQINFPCWFIAFFAAAYCELATYCVGAGSDAAGGGGTGGVGDNGTKDVRTATTSPILCGPIPDSLHDALVQTAATSQRRVLMPAACNSVSSKSIMGLHVRMQLNNGHAALGLGDLQLVPSGVISKCPISKTPTQVSITAWLFDTSYWCGFQEKITQNRAFLGGAGTPEHTELELLDTQSFDFWCSKFSCIASHAGWTDAVGWLDPQKIGEFFTRWAATRPQWTRAVERVRSTCLGGRLPPQGTYLDCPAYDIFYCALAVLYKNAEASAWRTGTQCEQARAFVMACPICPSECFAPTIPINSCNLCKNV